jgi:RNA polymerase sigma factor (sigma-70 family)
MDEGRKRRNRFKREGPLVTDPMWQDDKARNWKAFLVWSALQLLPDRDRQVLEATFYDEKSSAEVGAVMGIRASTVNVLRHRALKKLKRLLENRHGDE